MRDNDGQADGRNKMRNEMEKNQYEKKRKRSAHIKLQKEISF